MVPSIHPTYFMTTQFLLIISIAFLWITHIFLLAAFWYSLATSSCPTPCSVYCRDRKEWWEEKVVFTKRKRGQGGRLVSVCRSGSAHLWRRQQKRQVAVLIYGVTRSGEWLYGLKFCCLTWRVALRLSEKKVSYRILYFEHWRYGWAHWHLHSCADALLDVVEQFSCSTSTPKITAITVHARLSKAPCRPSSDQYPTTQLQAPLPRPVNGQRLLATPLDNHSIRLSGCPSQRQVANQKSL